MRVLQLHSVSDVANNNLGVVLAERGELGPAMREKGDVAGAIDHYERAPYYFIILDPNILDACRELTDAVAALPGQGSGRCLAEFLSNSHDRSVHDEPAAPRL